MKPVLTPEEIAALQVFATNYGRTWRSRLSELWTIGNEIPELRSVRNKLGPEGLKGFKPPWTQ